MNEKQKLENKTILNVTNVTLDLTKWQTKSEEENKKQRRKNNNII